MKASMHELFMLDGADTYPLMNTRFMTEGVWVLIYWPGYETVRERIEPKISNLSIQGLATQAQSMLHRFILDGEVRS